VSSTTQAIASAPPSRVRTQGRTPCPRELAFVLLSAAHGFDVFPVVVDFVRGHPLLKALAILEQYGFEQTTSASAVRSPSLSYLCMARPAHRRHA
jgi:hypothetical protein